MMKDIQLYLGIALILLILVLIADLLRLWMKATGSWWQKFLAVGYHSATILWQRTVMICTAIVGALITLADFFGAPGVSSAIEQYIRPELVPLIMIGIAVLTEFARRRTLG